MMARKTRAEIEDELILNLAATSGALVGHDGHADVARFFSLQMDRKALLELLERLALEEEESRVASKVAPKAESAPRTTPGRREPTRRLAVIAMIRELHPTGLPLSPDRKAIQEACLARGVRCSPRTVSRACAEARR